MKSKLILAGIVLSIVLFSCQTPVEKESSPQKPAEKKETDKASIKLINPLIESKGFAQLYFDEVLNLREDLLRIADSTVKSMPGLSFSFYFRDLTNGATIFYNEKRKYSPASLMKVPIMMTALKYEEETGSFLKKKLTYSKEKHGSMTNIDGVSYTDQKQYTVKELIGYMIEYSDNIATLMLLNELEIGRVKVAESAMGVITRLDQGEMDSIINVRSYANFFRSLYNSSYLKRSNSNLALEFLTKSRFEGGIRKVVEKQTRVAHKFGQRDISSQVIKPKDRKTDQLHHVAIVYLEHKPYLLGIMTKSDKGKAELSSVIEFFASQVHIRMRNEVRQITRYGIPADQR